MGLENFIEEELEGLDSYIEKDLEGVKHDQDKLRWDLMPFDALEDVARVFQEGAKKYGDRNWEKGMKWSRCFSAALRHLFAFWMGEDRDSEWGISHLAHAVCNILFLLTYWKRKIGKADRGVNDE